MARAEERVDVHAAVNVAMSTKGSPMRATGIAFLLVGLAALVAGCVVFLLAFPGTWYDETPEAANMIRVTVAGITVGIVFILFGFTSLAFARTVVGTGGVEHYEAEPPLEHAATPAHREPWLDDPAAEPWPEEAQPWVEGDQQWPAEEAWQESWPEDGTASTPEDAAGWPEPSWPESEEDQNA